MAVPNIFPGRISARAAISVVSRYRHLEPVDLIGPRRDRLIAWPRQEAMWILRQRTTMSTPQIGRMLGNRDHTTILSGLCAIERRRRDDPDYRADTDRLLALIDRRIAEATPPESVRDTAERLILDPAGASRGDVLHLAAGILAIAAVQVSTDLTDPEARTASRQMLAGHPETT